MPVEIPKDKWPGNVREITIGATEAEGGTRGSVFKVRFSPTKPGTWTLAKTTSNRSELDGRKEGLVVTCAPSSHPGFWVVDTEQTGGRWYGRTDGSHP